MEFYNIDGKRKLWAVRYDGDPINILGLLFQNWTDVDWLKEFFLSNKGDLERNFKICHNNIFLQYSSSQNSI